MSEAELTRIAQLESELSIANQRMRTLETENAILGKRAALAVTQEADRIEAQPPAANECYRCGHSTLAADCDCCQNGHNLVTA